MSSGIEDAIAAAWAKNRAVVIERVLLMDDALRDLAAGHLGAEARTEARSAAHKLSGSLGMYGYPDASVTAARVEAVLTGGRDDLAVLAKALRQMMLEITREPPTVG